MSKKELSRALHKELGSVESEMKKMGGSLAVDLKTQEKILPKLEARREKLKRDRVSLKFRLEKFIGDGGDISKETFDDPEFIQLKERYFDTIYELDEVNKTITIVEESIAEAQMLRPGGFPKEDGLLSTENL